MIETRKSVGMALLALASVAGCGISDAVVSLSQEAGSAGAAAGASGMNAKNSGGAATSSGGSSSGGRATGGAIGSAGGAIGSAGGAIGSAGGAIGSAGGVRHDAGIADSAADAAVDGAGTDAGAGGVEGGTGGAGTGGHATGGVPASGGRANTGGAIGTGGRAGTGGAPSTGGAPGTGGAGSLCPRVDCSNPNCVDDVCVDGAPSGWTGPIALYEGDPSTTPACTAPYSSLTFTANANLTQEPAQCSACGGCTLVSQPVCGAYGAPSYSPGCPDTGQTTCLGVCTSFPFALTSINWQSPWISPQGCGPNIKKPTPTLPAPHWGTAARACALPFPAANGCAAGSICSPIPKAPFNGKVCIYQSGDVACPSPSLYSGKRLYYSTVTDQRDCGNCSCRFADPQPSCVGTVTVFSDANCQNVSYTSGPGCTTAPAGSCKGNFTVVNANCADNPAGGQPIGTIDPAGPVTICCSP